MGCVSKTPPRKLIAYKETPLPIGRANILNAIFLGEAPRAVVRSSNRPEQFRQFEQVARFLLPALDADVAERIAVLVQQHQRHQPPLQ
jgi:hypothetical protein